MKLRQKILLICFAIILLLGIGGLSFFADSWQKLSRAYGFMQLHQTLLNAPLKIEDANNWAKALNQEAFSFHLNLSSSPQQITWLKQPAVPPKIFEEKLLSKILFNIDKSKTESGSFELDSLPSPFTSYFITYKRLPTEIWLLGTTSHLSLWHISQWSAPFLVFMILAVVISVILATLLASQTSKSYSELLQTIDHIATGRLEQLQLPNSSDPEIKALSKSVESLASRLNLQTEKISEFSKLAEEDPMTGLNNYRAFSKEIKKIISDPRLDGAIALVIIDLDDFKKVNDTHGHLVGDFVLKSLGTMMKGQLRSTEDQKRMKDFFARYGGEEFVCLFPNVSEASAHIPALRLLTNIKSNPLEVTADISGTHKSFHLSISASMGLSVWIPGRFHSPEEWILDADQALYRAKNSGKSKIVQCTPTERSWS